MIIREFAIRWRCAWPSRGGGQNSACCLKNTLRRIPRFGLTHVCCKRSARTVIRRTLDSLVGTAVRVNRYVVPLLLGDKRPPRRLPPHYAPGSREEAVLYAAQFLPAWRNTSGAITWLREVAAEHKRRPSRRSKRQAKPAPVSVTREDLLDLPQNPTETWQADVRPLPLWFKEQGAPMRPWAMLVVDISQDLIVLLDLSQQQLPSNEWLDMLAGAMINPQAGPPRRPGVIELTSPEVIQAVGTDLQEIGVTCRICDDLRQLDSLLEMFAQQMQSEVGGPRALVDIPGLQIAHRERFYGAAAACFQQRPWREVPGDTILRVECREAKPIGALRRRDGTVRNDVGSGPR